MVKIKINFKIAFKIKPSNMIVYGIKNCDTVKKTTTWLKENNIEFEFHDYKTKGISKDILTNWTNQISWEILVNKKGTTWKKLPPEIQNSITDTKSAIELMANHTSLIKRPVIEIDNKILAVGFDKSHLEAVL